MVICINFFPVYLIRDELLLAVILRDLAVKCQILILMEHFLAQGSGAAPDVSRLGVLGT